LPSNSPQLARESRWGGNDLRTLLITATTSVYKLESHAKGFVPQMKQVK
jgi:hypothetical protein